MKSDTESDTDTENDIGFLLVGEEKGWWGLCCKGMKIAVSPHVTGKERTNPHNTSQTSQMVIKPWWL